MAPTDIDIAKYDLPYTSFKKCEHLIKDAKIFSYIFIVILVCITNEKKNVVKVQKHNF